MKIVYSWLQEWVEVPWQPAELGSRLTMAGFELESLEPAAPPFSGVIVAEILSAERHPQADKLRVCRVAVGGGASVQVVCGAANVHVGLKSALATVGAKLPGDLDIKAAKVRGVESAGMLASGRELGLAESLEGILELPDDAPVGQSLREYLKLDDVVLDLAVSPNRGDAMSVLGIAREVAALTGKGLIGGGRDIVAQESSPWFQRERASAPGPDASDQPRSGQRDASQRDRVKVFLDAPAACPTFAGCVIRDVDNRASSPIWLRERLRRAGVRSISPVVDVTNYVMLELGQPMHAYDLAKLHGDIHVRMAHADEPITLLNGSRVEASEDVLFIADAEGAVGLAGIMGGERTAVSDDTTDVFLEAAFFAPAAVSGRARRWGLVTDASQRFERGVDPTLQARALDRAIGLLSSTAERQPGPKTLARSAEHVPQRRPVPLRRSRLERLLGASFPDEQVVNTLTALQMKVSGTERARSIDKDRRVDKTGNVDQTGRPDGMAWSAIPPPHRFDITIEADLIEEVARIVGFQEIPETDAVGPHQFRPLREERAPESVLLEAMAMRGYQEAITFAFVDPALQIQLFPDRAGLPLTNPIASDLSVMRLSLWPGLIRAALENQRRQQDRIRLFEHGAIFLPQEVDCLAGIAVGPRLPEQWGIAADARVPVDFFDVKADVEALLTGTGDRNAFTFEPASLSCLHPGRAARILRRGQPAGWLGELHPSLAKRLDFTYAPVLFEIETAAVAIAIPRYEEISRFPQVRRDLAIVVDEFISLSAVAERVILQASHLLHHLRIFDVYRGPGIEPGRKSVALGLIFQAISRTLTDGDVEQSMVAIVADLRTTLNARIRE